MNPLAIAISSFSSTLGTIGTKLLIGEIDGAAAISAVQAAQAQYVQDVAQAADKLKADRATIDTLIAAMPKAATVAAGGSHGG